MVGTPKSIDSIPRTLDPDHERPLGSTWIDAHRSTLPSNKWVAADGSGRHVTDATIAGLMDQIDRVAFDQDQLTITFIPGDAL